MGVVVAVASTAHTGKVDIMKKPQKVGEGSAHLIAAYYSYATQQAGNDEEALRTLFEQIHIERVQITHHSEGPCTVKMPLNQHSYRSVVLEGVVTVLIPEGGRRTDRAARETVVTDETIQYHIRRTYVRNKYTGAHLQTRDEVTACLGVLR